VAAADEREASASMNLIQRLQNVVGGDNRLDTCARAVRTVFPAHATLGARAELSALCRTRGVALEVVNEAPFEGRLTWHREQPRIVLRKLFKATRQRFTLAHELGHLIVEELLAERKLQLFRGMPTSNAEEAEEEAVANALAAELLMPLAAMYRFGSFELTHTIFDTGLLQFDVSASAFLQRYAEVSRRRVLSLVVLPSDIKKEAADAFIDDGWYLEPDKPVRRNRRTVCFKHNRRFDSFGSTQETCSISWSFVPSTWEFDVSRSFGLLPKVKLISSKPM
jgi:hypothetical protein